MSSNDLKFSEEDSGLTLIASESGNFLPRVAFKIAHDGVPSITEDKLELLEGNSEVTLNDIDNVMFFTGKELEVLEEDPEKAFDEHAIPLDAIVDARDFLNDLAQYSQISEETNECII